MGLATTQTLVKEYSYFILHQTTTNSTLLIMDSIMKMMSSNPNQNRLVAAAELEPGASCEFGSPKYYALCGFGGLLSCGITHTAVTPLDLVKCRLQVNKEKYKSLGNGFKLTVAESGASGLFLGWAPTAIGYSMQGICKFGSMSFSRMYTLESSEKRTHTSTKPHFIWQLLLLPSSLLISLFLLWSHARCESRPVPLALSQPH